MRSAALIACRDEDARYLLIRRSARVRAPLQVCFPGGHVEDGEAPAAAAVREMREELGVAIEIESLALDVFEPERGVHLYGFLASLTSRAITPDPKEVSEVLWLPGREARDHPDALQPSTDLFLDALRRFGS